MYERGGNGCQTEDMTGNEARAYVCIMEKLPAAPRTEIALFCGKRRDFKRGMCENKAHPAVEGTIHARKNCGFIFHVLRGEYCRMER